MRTDRSQNHLEDAARRARRRNPERRARRPLPALCFLAALLCLPGSVFAQGIQTEAETACADTIYAGNLADTLAKLAQQYTGTTRWARSDVDGLCEGTRAPKEPANCFANAMLSEADWTTGQQLRWTLALELCAGTNNSAQTIACFDQEKLRLVQTRPGEMTAIEIWRSAAGKCQRRPVGAPGTGQPSTFGQPPSNTQQQQFQQTQPQNQVPQNQQQQQFQPPAGQQPVGQQGTGQPGLSEREQELLDKIKKLEEEKKKLQLSVPPEITEDKKNIRDFLGVKDFALEEYGSLMKGEPRQFSLKAEQGGLYAVTAACDKNCKDIDLILLDSNGRQIMSATDQGTDAKPVLQIEPGTSTQYFAQVMMQDCSPGPCSFGLFLVKDRTAFAVKALPRWQKPDKGMTTVQVTPVPKPDPTTTDQNRNPTTVQNQNPTTGLNQNPNPVKPPKPTPSPPKPTSSLTGVAYKTRAQVSSSTLPIVQNSDHCAFLVENYIPRDYGFGKWDPAEVKDLCQGTSNSAEPARCYYRAMFEQGPHRDKFNAWTPELAMRLCAGKEKGERAATNNADARIACFQWLLAREAHSADKPRNYLYWPASGPKPDGRRKGVYAPGKARWEYAMLGCWYDRQRNPEPKVSAGSDAEEDILKRIRPGSEAVKECALGLERDVPSEKWDRSKALRLCAGTRIAKEPKECFVALTFNHGKLTDEAISYCGGTNDSDATVDCAIRRGYGAETVRRSTTCMGNPPHWPEPTSR